MRTLFDTHVLLWIATDHPRLAGDLRAVALADSTEPCFSAASIWEVAIKADLGRPDFDVEPAALRRGLLANGFEEVAITGEHAAEVRALPGIHRDPFDRVLVAQARVERLPLVTVDMKLAGYGEPVRVVSA
ncbi:type II toxin-antitoxin system VapC family toxin [Demequina soli]|uniref:type II toxin-antitoxin system VapC family toxin n=1 Tax=Demequina soli TaxID=1638987 RepID=UPI000780B327|nr:type II toxin-antitoxin system VapC family toxin [Demequina soli]